MIPIDLSSRVAIVTGASSGLGSEIARTLARAGAAVVVNYHRHCAAADRVAGQIEAAGGRAVAIAADVSDPSQTRAMVTRASQELGPVTIVVNNAGRELAVDHPFTLGWHDYQEMIDLNLKAVYNLTRAAHHDMRAAKWGRIVTIGAVALSRPFTGAAAYVAGKGAMMGFSRALAHELGPDGVTVNTVVPGWIPVERHGGTDPAVFEAIAAETPLRRMGVPADIAGAVAYLCSDLASFVTATAIAVNGGLGGQV
jgi:3-oxoacyl-[acyl-carrier protein] reductase